MLLVQVESSRMGGVSVLCSKAKDFSVKQEEFSPSQRMTNWKAILIVQLAIRKYPLSHGKFSNDEK